MRSRCSKPLSASSSRRPDPTWTSGLLDGLLPALTSTSSPRSLSRRTLDTMELACVLLQPSLVARRTPSPCAELRLPGPSKG